MKKKNKWYQLATELMRTACQDRLQLPDDLIDEKTPLHTIEKHLNNQLSQRLRMILCETYAEVILNLPISTLVSKSVLECPFSSFRALMKRVFGHWYTEQLPDLQKEYISGFGLFFEALLCHSYRAKINQDAHHIYLHLSVSKDEIRKRSGAHYTPISLAQDVTRQAFTYFDDQLQIQGLSLSQKLQKKDLTICDPSAGAGIFLQVCAQYLARHICDHDLLQTQEDIKGEAKYRYVLRFVIEHFIYGIELNPVAACVTKLSLWALSGGELETYLIIERRILVSDALTSSPQLWGRQTFDVILGNPPYISLYGRGSQAQLYDDDYLNLLRDELGDLDGQRVISGRLNLFLSFMVLATKWIEANEEDEKHRLHSTKRRPIMRLIAFVLPDTIITNQAYHAMRKMLTESGRLIEAQRHKHSLFKGASVGSAVVYWRSRPRITSTQLMPPVILSEIGEVVVSINERTTLITKRPGCSWQAVTTKKLVDAVLPHSSSIPLSEMAEVRDGFNTGSAARRKSLITKDQPQPVDGRLILEGKNIHPFLITSRSVWIKASEVVAMSRFDRAKIIYRQTAPHIIAAVDTEGLCYLNSAHAILPHHNDPQLLFALCAYLNSTPFKKRYQLLTGEVRRTFPQVHISSMKAIRIPRRLLDLEDRLTLQLIRLGKSLSDPLRGSSNHLIQLDEQVDALHRSCFSDQDPNDQSNGYEISSGD